MTNFQSGKMDAAVVVLRGKRSILPPLPPPPPPPPAASSSNLLISKVSPSVFLIIIILAIIFFVSGLLHLLIRYLLRPQRRDPDEMDSLTVLQGQLQQLFHLHDAGVDQSFIDTLPIFSYKAIIGVKSPFDCAVCLSEFEADDKLRLLPKCSHAFHMDCIDTWLLSHSTCPLCRASLIPDFSSNRHCSPIVLVLESGSESSREIIPEREVGRVSSHLSFQDELRIPNSGILPKSCEIQIQAREDENQIQDMANSGEKVLPVKLGKYRNQNPGESSSTTTNNVDSRRCFSMGSFAYIMDENSSLRVPVRTPLKKPSLKKPSLPLNPGHRPAMSECGGGDSRREELVNFEAFRNSNSHLFNNAATIEEINNNNNTAIGNNIRGESFSISKIWLRGKRDNNPITEQPSRRAFSFRFPLITEEKGNKKGGRRTISEADVGRWANNSNGVGSDFDSQSICSLDSQANNPPSFARKTLLWLMGRQNKVVHSQFSSASSNV